MILQNNVLQNNRTGLITLGISIWGIYLSLYFPAIHKSKLED